MKVLGIPAPDEWIDIESNQQGGPPTTYTVPTDNRLTLVSLLRTPDASGNMTANVSIDGSFLGTATMPSARWRGVSMLLQWNCCYGDDIAGSDTPTVAFPRGAIVSEGQVHEVHLGGAEFPEDTFVVRGCLEKVE